MPQYSFMEHFVPFVLDGSKPHTIRARRKNPAKIGDPVYLFFGLRTKWCKRLRNEICTDTKSIAISEMYGILLYSRLLTAEEIIIANNNPLDPLLPVWETLSKDERNELAWKDGFRPDEGKSKSFELMLRFWRKTHVLPWIGDIIYWNPSKI